MLAVRAHRNPARMREIVRRLQAISGENEGVFGGQKWTGRRSNNNSHTNSCRNDGQMRKRGEGEEEEKEGGREKLEVDDDRVCQIKGDEV